MYGLFLSGADVNSHYASLLSHPATIFLPHFSLHTAQTSCSHLPTYLSTASLKLVIYPNLSKYASFDALCIRSKKVLSGSAVLIAAAICCLSLIKTHQVRLGPLSSDFNSHFLLFSILCIDLLHACTHSRRRPDQLPITCHHLPRRISITCRQLLRSRCMHKLALTCLRPRFLAPR